MVWSDRINESKLQTVVCKEVEECVSLKGSLYRGRELLSELGSWLSSFIYNGEGERDFVSGLGSRLSFTHEK